MTRFRSTAQLYAIAAVVFSAVFLLAPYGSAQDPTISVTNATACTGIGPGGTICLPPGGTAPFTLAEIAGADGTLLPVQGTNTSPVYELDNTSSPLNTTFSWLFSASLASDQSLTCEEMGIFTGNSCTITGPLGTVGTGVPYGPPPGIMPGQYWDPDATITFTGISAGDFDLTFTGFGEGDTSYVVDGDLNEQCSTSALGASFAYDAVCGPYLYPPDVGSNGINVNINNDFWGYSASLASSYGETEAQMQTLYAINPGNWYAIIDFPTGKTAIEDYPDTNFIFYYPGFWVNGVNGSAPRVSSFSYMYGSFSDNMNANPASTDAEAAYDIWMNGYSNEVMIWNDQANRGGAGYQGCKSSATATKLSFGGTNGIPALLWNYVKCSSGSTGEQIFLLDQKDLGIGTTTVYGVPTGSVDILSMLKWLMTNGTTSHGVLTPYLPTTSTLTQVEYGFEVASTGGVPEKFQVNSLGLNYAIPSIVVTTPTITWATPAAITYGTALSATQLDAVATNLTNTNNGNIPGSPVAGTYSYSPALGTVLTAGPQTLSVTFTPTDTIDYTTAMTTVQLTVNPAPLTVTANNANMTVGSAVPTLTASYSGFENGDTSSVLSGAPSLTTTATSSSPAGTYPITAALGTLSAANYSFVFVNGTLSVVQAPTEVLTTTAVLSGSAAGGYTALVTVTNSGTGDATNAMLTSATLGSAAGSVIPQSLGTIAANGGSAMVTVSFPGSAGADGATVVEKYAGTYTGGTFSGSIRAKLP